MIAVLLMIGIVQVIVGGLEKASRIPFNIVQQQYAKYDGDLVKMNKYIKTTPRGR